MRRITPRFTKELAPHFGIPKDISRAIPYPVSNFRELVEHIAKLSFENKDHLLFFRGQHHDYRNGYDKSTFLPTINRNKPSRQEIEARFKILNKAGIELVKLFESEGVSGASEVKKRKLIRWSILQHYEVCPTPLLDFTQSLRVACSFATIRNISGKAFIFVFGFPYLTNRISHNSEHELINIRLLSICPPTALRPYFQEGYLVGKEDSDVNIENNKDIDFNRRLIAKFEIPNDDQFWGDNFHKIPEESLYPQNDPIKILCAKIKDDADAVFSGELHGKFLKEWTELQVAIQNLSPNPISYTRGFSSTIEGLLKSKKIASDIVTPIKRIQEFRNQVVHFPQGVKPNDLVNNTQRINGIINSLKKDGGQDFPIKG